MQSRDTLGARLSGDVQVRHSVFVAPVRQTGRGTGQFRALGFGKG